MELIRLARQMTLAGWSVVRRPQLVSGGLTDTCELDCTRAWFCLLKSSHVGCAIMWTCNQLYWSWAWHWIIRMTQTQLLTGNAICHDWLHPTPTPFSVGINTCFYSLILKSKNLSLCSPQFVKRWSNFTLGFLFPQMWESQQTEGSAQAEG